MRWAPFVCLILLSLLPSLASPAEAQSTGRIAGTVTGDAGQPLPGVGIQVVGTRLGTLSGANGSFVITGVPAGSHTVRAALIGYGATEQSVTIVAGQAATVSFQLQPEALELEGIVAVGYGTQQKRDVTGAIHSVKPEEIRQIPTSNAVDAIKGRVPGVDIVASGYAPGAGVRVRVRGERSMRAGNDPLYVVDGIPLSGGIQDFNPSDIQSIEVLKDASATAIYGARGANGVVLITTRQGREGATRITYDTYAGVQNIISKVDMMNGEEFAEHKRESYRTAGKYTTDESLFYPVELESLALGRSTDWQEEVMRTGLQQNHQLGVSGGNESTRFSASFNYFDQQGITRGQGYGRTSGGFNLDHTTGRLRMGISSQLSSSTQNLGRGNGIWSEALLNNPLGVPRDSAGNVVFLPTPDGLRSNPLADIENWKHENVRTRVFGSVFAELELAEGLQYRVNFGPDLLFLREGQFRGAETNARRLSPADAWQERQQSFTYTLDNLLTLKRELGVHRVDLTGLYSIQRERNDWIRSAVSELPYEHQEFYNLGSASTIQGVGSRLSEWAMQSFMGRANYSLHDRYLLTLTGRLDGSSRLAPGNKYAFFPSVAVGWRLSDEPFLAGTGLFSDLKLRASYGRTGNTSIDPYQTQGSLQRTTYVLGDKGAYGYGPSELENARLEWEKTDQLDVGLDFGVLDNRVTGAIDVYHSNTRDLLMLRQLPTATGFSSILENIGETSNTGVELSISTVNMERDGFRWTSDIGWSMNRNRIVSLYGGREDDIGNRWFIGQPMNVFYDYQFDGIWQLDQAAEAKGYKQVPGQIRVVDQNQDGQINDADRVILGSSFPDWTGSLSNRVEWKSLDLSALVTARQGFMVYDGFGTSFNNLFGRYNNLRVDYWTPTNPSNTHPRPNADHVDNPLYGTSRAYKDASFVRVRNVTLGYTVPQGLARRWGGESLRIYATAQDPFTFTRYQGFDPESGTGAGVPSYRTLLVGASMGF